VAKALGGQAGTFGVAVRNLKTGQSFTIDSDSFYPSASLYKLAVMYEVFRQNAAGGLAFDETLTVQDQDIDETDDDEPMYLHQQVTTKKALELMIDLSSNAAAHILTDRVGWMQINQSMANVGLNHTRLPVGDWKAQMTDWRSDTACTSPGDMLAFFDHPLPPSARQPRCKRPDAEAAPGPADQRPHAGGPAPGHGGGAQDRQSRRHRQ